MHTFIHIILFVVIMFRRRPLIAVSVATPAALLGLITELNDEVRGL